jgi:hypothetical protein
MAAPQFVPFSKSDMEVPVSFSPVDDEPPLRWQRAVHLAPRDGLGVVRRAVFFALFTWLPIAAWAFVRGRFLEAPAGEPLLQHYGIHVRCLVAIPLLILGEATLHAAGLRYLPQFVRNGLVDDATRPRFDGVLRAVRQWRDASLPWLLAFGVALAWALVNRGGNRTDEMSWAFDANGSLGFGGMWFAYVVRPIFAALMLGWLWRIVLLAMLVGRLGRLDLSLVPSHPDRAGGLGFIERLPGAFAPVSLGISAMLASRWAHQIVHHGETLTALKLPALMFVIVWSLLLLAPLVPLIPVMHLARRAALASYAAMLAEQGRLVRRRWIDGTTRSDSPMLEPSGVGVIADAAAMFKAVESMRSVPIGKTAIMGILLPVAVPMIAVATLQVPMRDLLLGLVKTLL